MNEKELLDEKIHFLSNQINYLEIEQNHYGIDKSKIIKELYNEVYEIIELKNSNK